MTTIPSRIPYLRPALDSVLAQSVRDFSLNLYIPKVCARTNEPYELHGFFDDCPDRLTVCRLDTDYGPATKLLGPLEALSTPRDHDEQTVITVDDDVVLEPHAIEELLSAAARYPHEALGFMGVSDGRFVHAEALAANGVSDVTVSVLGGYRGILYPPDALDHSLVEDHKAVADRRGVFLDDDHLFAWNLARRGIPRRVIATRYAGREFALNVGLLDLPDAISLGPDGGTAVMDSRRRLVDYYESNGWPTPP